MYAILSSEVQINGSLLFIHRILGAPDKKTWPEVAQLPYYFSGLPINKENRLKFTVWFSFICYVFYSIQ